MASETAVQLLLLTHTHTHADTLGPVEGKRETRQHNNCRLPRHRHILRCFFFSFTSQQTQPGQRLRQQQQPAFVPAGLLTSAAVAVAVAIAVAASLSPAHWLRPAAAEKFFLAAQNFSVVAVVVVFVAVVVAVSFYFR